MITLEWDMVLLSAVIFVPALFALVLIFFPKGSDEWMRWFTLGGTVVTLVLTIILLLDFLKMQDERVLTGHTGTTMLEHRVDSSTVAASRVSPQESRDLVVRVPWIERFNIQYYLGVDGISMALVLLTSVLSFLGMIASWNIEKSVKGYCMLFLILETGMLGTFLSLDLFLFYIFWEVMLLPMYFLIGIWGGPRREYAAIKFFLYTLLGSVLILVAILAFYFTDITPLDAHLQQVAAAKEKLAVDAAPNSQAKRDADAAKLEAGAVHQIVRNYQYKGQSVVNTFDILLLQKVGRESPGMTKPLFPMDMQIWTFILLFIGFAIKVPVFPFHTWLPDAHVEAPTPISMILAGVLLKMGGYGILRIAYPICPWAAYELAWWLGLFGIINIVYGAFAAMAQTDFKKLVAYSSISHMGYVILGIAVWASGHRSQYWDWGVYGAMYQMIAHGITSAGMFFCVGVIYDRAHHRDLNNFGGLNNSMPVYSGISAVIFFGAMGLPGLCGFVGEFFTILGTWNYSPLFAILAAGTVVLTAAYILWTIQRVYLGENAKYHGLPDIGMRELVCIVPLVILAVVLGVWPNSVLTWMGPSLDGFVDKLAGIKFPSM